MTHIQKAIAAIGDRGKYQKVLLAFFILVYMELGLMLIGSTFVFMNPQFQCPGMDDPSEGDACPIIEQCTIVNEYTATYYAGLYCDKQTDRSFVQSALYIGSILGLLFLAPYADEKGKKKMFVISQGVCIVGLLLNVIGVYSSVTFIIILGQIVIGSGAYCILIIGYVIVGQQICEDKLKQVAIITLNAVWALSQIIIAGLYFWYNYWANYIVLILLIPNIGLFLFGLFFLVESPYYLIQKQENIEKAVDSLKHIALFNSVDLRVMADVESELRAAIETIKEENHKNNDQPKVSRFAIFKDVIYMKTLLMVSITAIGINAYYYGIQFSLGKIGTNFGYNILLTGSIEFVAFLSENFFITKLPRKWGQIGVNICCIILGFLFFFDFSEVGQTLLLGGGRFFNAIAIGLLPFLQSEPFPHYFRSSVWGYIEGLSQIGSFFTPYIVTACENSNINSLIVFSFILVALGIVPMLFIKETLDKTEDELMEEHELESSLDAGNSINLEIEMTQRRLLN